MHTFYVDNCAIGADEARHAFRVLRLKKGDEVACLDGGRRYLARIAEISDSGGAVELIQELPSNEPPVCITVYQGLPKSEKLEFLAQKLTELGVSRLVPVRMERSIAKADGDRRMDRLARIAREAVKQCRRAAPMEITPPMTWKEAVSDMEKRELMIVPWENASATRMADVHKQNPDARDIGILIGPEGGISQGEIDAAPARPVLLGPRILRAETASVTAAVLAMSMWGDI